MNRSSRSALARVGRWRAIRASAVSSRRSFGPGPSSARSSRAIASSRRSAGRPAACAVRHRRTRSAAASPTPRSRRPPRETRDMSASRTAYAASSPAPGYQAPPAARPPRDEEPFSAPTVLAESTQRVAELLVGRIINSTIASGSLRTVHVKDSLDLSTSAVPRPRASSAATFVREALGPASCAANTVSRAVSALRPLPQEHSSLRG